MGVSRPVLLKMRNVQENQTTRITSSNFYFFLRKSCPLWNNVQRYCRSKYATGDNRIRRMRFKCWITKAADTHSEYVILRSKYATGDNRIRRMRFECWITKAADTHSEYVILIALPWHQWLRERATV